MAYPVNAKDNRIGPAMALVGMRVISAKANSNAVWTPTPSRVAEQYCSLAGSAEPSPSTHRSWSGGMTDLLVGSCAPRVKLSPWQLRRIFGIG